MKNHLSIRDYGQIALGWIGVALIVGACVLLVSQGRERPAGYDEREATIHRDF